VRAQWNPDADAAKVDDFLTYAWVICWGLFNSVFLVYVWWVIKQVADKE